MCGELLKPNVKPLIIYFVGHINNLYNTCFWKLVLESSLNHQQAEARLKVLNTGKYFLLSINDKFVIRA